MEAQLVSAIQYSLNLHLYQNALFLCERLVAGFPKEENFLLLATCYYHSKQIHRAYHLLKNSANPQSCYLLSLCCMELGKHDEAENALTWNAADSQHAKIPNGAAGLYLLGKIARRSNRHTLAIERFRQALKLDPLLWVAFEELCQMGAGETAMCVMNTAHREVRNELEAPAPLDKDEMAPESPASPGSTPPATAPRMPSEPDSGGTAGSGRSLLVQDALRPFSLLGRGSITPVTGSAAHTPESPNMPSGPPPLQRGNLGSASRTRNLGSSTGRGKGSLPGTITSTPGFDHRRKFARDTHQGKPAEDSRFKLRKVSDMLFRDSPQQMANLQGEGQGSPSVDGDAGLPLGEPSKDGLESSIQLIRILGEGVRHLATYSCSQAIAAFERLPKAQYDTAWVLCQVAKAQFAQVDYPASASTFRKAREKDPFRVEDMEIFSTVLWHLRRGVELAYLSHEMIAIDRLSPQAWCVMGNCFSLQKEHRRAIRLFQRALQLDPDFTYAHTLCGHEHLANEDFDKGLACYRNAVRIDRRHFNAWYGLGQIYLRQEKYELAENHFRRALHINPSSSVLLCYLGMSLHKLGRNAEALEQLQVRMHWEGG